MNSLAFTIYRIFIPKPIRSRILKRTLRKNIIDYYSSIPEEDIDEEQKEVLSYLKTNPLSIFPYSFSSGYSPGKTDVLHDPSNGMHYVIHEGKRLYFRKGWSTGRIQRYYSDLCREQDPGSPHCYITGSFKPGSDDIVADIGAAEGNFSLSVVEKVKKLYLVEYDRRWIRALEETFAPWKHKVEIIGKYISDTDDEKHIKLDSLMKQGTGITFLKIDVDGHEMEVLNGFRESVSGNRPFKIALCTYHRHDDELNFTSMFRNNGFNVTPSRGYMIHYYDKKIRAPWLRRGLIRAVR